MGNHNPKDWIRQTDFFVMVKQIQGEWIPNFEEGKIYSVESGDYITPCVNRRGYRFIPARLNMNDRTTICLHRALLIMKTGIPVDPRLEVDHINRNPGDNRIENLRWVTPSENIRYRPEKFNTAEQIRREREAGATTRSLAEKYHYSPRMILNIVAGERYDPAKYPGTERKNRLHYSHPTSGGSFMRWCS